MAEAPERTESTVFSKLLVTGMDCPDCAAKVEKAVKRMPGVGNATIVFPAGRLDVEYDSQQTGVTQVLDKIKKLGYEAREDDQKISTVSQTTDFCIIGMDCADCAAKLEKRMAKVPGIETAHVNFGASKMTVSHSGPVAEILSTIEKMGYSGKVDEGLRITNEPASFWKSNQYARPTVISLIMLVSGLIAGKLEAQTLIVNGLFLIGICLGGFLPARNGISVLINAREFDMNFLMTIAVVGASALSAFEEAATVVFLFSFGNALQGYTLDKTRNSIRALMEIAPKEALVRRGITEITLQVKEIVLGDVIIVRPGERIAMDGKVSTGYSTVNQAPITGESIPVEKQPGDEIYAGTVNERGSLEVKVTKLAKDNTISRIIHMVEEAQGQRAPSQQFVDKFAKYYTPMVIVLAALVAALPPLLFGQPFEKWFYEAMAMLLVACPCALVISTPVSIVSAIGNAAKNGVLIKGGMYLEAVGALSVIAFDKTGTLTEGKPQVTDIIPIDGIPDKEFLSIASAIESRSEHPLAEAIVKSAKEHGAEISSISAFEAIPGKGARAMVQGKTYQIGNSRLFSEQTIDLKHVEDEVSRLQNEGKTVMMLGDDKRILGLIAVADVLRENSGQAINKLKKAGIKKIIMLTGDNESTARAIATKAGVDDFRADLLPEDKVDAIKSLLVEHGKVAMVGDGVNDAPALAISTVGIAMGAAGTDTALETADIALMADDLTKLTDTIKLSRKTLGIIKQNIAFALIVKGLILLLVIPGWLTLWLAVAGDMGSSLLVTLNAMRLLRVKHED
ncbi:heavy metal translocating P-type ATPase [Methanosarcina sp. Z-7115]|uniref:Heavy metal translocating P-type ATPase n=1 Tax=Methanosarcina baikalica TaxID=3073890 RepID=A0ABU2D350_9EURY|nr:heavy metal translocating P-type ATPase [Methanosarcina sp. Z-7115]MDR7666408.1 heavy metal translocating P-type ATPase [Methanosarcina sp. Z-7115]